MRIVNLVENTLGAAGLDPEHGLCFYIETAKHKLLMDTGASDLLIANAEKKGIDLTQIDTVILSHGHYDHGGGIPAFAGLNPDARIYMQRSAFGEYYSQLGEKIHYIGIEPAIKELPQLVLVDGDYRIDEELALFAGIGRELPFPESNNILKVKQEDDTLAPDDFRHEQCLVLTQQGRHILFSGCAHHGILNVMARYRELYKADPDAVISGFHMMKKTDYSFDEIKAIVHTAHELKEFKKTVFYTGHCTGERAFEIMKEIMGGQLVYVHCGDEVVLPEIKKKGSSAMKWHKFFAWATVFCFIMTMFTGYKRK